MSSYIKIPKSANEQLFEYLRTVQAIWSGQKVNPVRISNYYLGFKGQYHEGLLDPYDSGIWVYGPLSCKVLSQDFFASAEEGFTLPKNLSLENIQTHIKLLIRNLSVALSKELKEKQGALKIASKMMRELNGK